MTRQAYTIKGWFSDRRFYKPLNDLGTSRNVLMECPSLPTDDGAPTTVLVSRENLVPVAGVDGPPVPSAPATSRSTDPATSKAAAAMQTPARMRDVYWIILELLSEHGALNDFELSDAAKAKGMTIIPTSIGKRRLELARQGYVMDSGTTGPSHTGSLSVRWTLTHAGREIVGQAVAS